MGYFDFIDGSGLHISKNGKCGMDDESRVTSSRRLTDRPTLFWPVQPLKARPRTVEHILFAVAFFAPYVR